MNSTESIKQENTQGPELRGYKKVCAKLGLSMCVYFICRLLAGYAAVFFFDPSETMTPSLTGFLYYLTLIILTYLVPIAFTLLIFNYHPPLRKLYEKPRRPARALGTFPAAYGLGYGVALLTLLASYFLSKSLGGETHIEQLLRPTTIEATTNTTELVMMMLLLVVAAPVFEEYWVRGIMFDALRPYGAGMAILISSILFGLMHGSLYMLFYTTALGLALGYIRYATGSLFTVTILHALINSISATVLLLQSLVDITNRQNRVLNTIDMMFLVFVFILIIVGIAVFLAKIPVIRKYRFENNWTQVSPWKKIGIFAASVPVIIMLVLAFNEISGHMLLRLLV